MIHLCSQFVLRTGVKRLQEPNGFYFLSVLSDNRDLPLCELTAHIFKECLLLGMGQIVKEPCTNRNVYERKCLFLFDTRNETQWQINKETQEMTTKGNQRYIVYFTI